MLRRSVYFSVEAAAHWLGSVPGKWAFWQQRILLALTDKYSSVNEPLNLKAVFNCPPNSSQSPFLALKIKGRQEINRFLASFILKKKKKKTGSTTFTKLILLPVKVPQCPLAPSQTGGTSKNRYLHTRAHTHTDIPFAHTLHVGAQARHSRLLVSCNLYMHKKQKDSRTAENSEPSPSPALASQHQLLPSRHRKLKWQSYEDRMEKMNLAMCDKGYLGSTHSPKATTTHFSDHHEVNQKVSSNNGNYWHSVQCLPPP